MPSTPPPPRRSDPPPSTVSRRGPRLAAISFLGFVVPWVAYISGQVVVQGLTPDVVPGPWTSCDEGRRSLERTLVSARSAAEEDLDPDQALRRFRELVGPTWRHLEALRRMCTSDDDRRALDALERLRYAEEHAVRREAASLAQLRRTVSATLGAPRASSAAPDASATPRADSPKTTND
jgi:hypothetical protein